MEPPWATRDSVLLACVTVWMENAVLSRKEAGGCSQVIKVTAICGLVTNPKKPVKVLSSKKPQTQRGYSLFRFRQTSDSVGHITVGKVSEWAVTDRWSQTVPNGSLQRAWKHLALGPGWGHLRKSHQRRMLPSLQHLRLHPQQCSGRSTLAGVQTKHCTVVSEPHLLTHSLLPLPLSWSIST